MGGVTRTSWEKRKGRYNKNALNYLTDAMIRYFEERPRLKLTPEEKGRAKMLLKINSPWNIPTRVINLEVMNGVGTLIKGMDNRVYGLDCMGNFLAFQRTSHDNFEEIKTEHFIPEVEVAFDSVKNKINLLTERLGLN